MTHQRRRHRRGSTLIYPTVAMTALMGFCSLGVDWRHVELVKTELQRSADAAALAGAGGLPGGVTTAQNLAVQYAGYNTTDGAPVVLDPSTDVEFGTWDWAARSFTVLTGSARSNANAMRITARRNGVPLMGMRILGKSAQNVTASAIATRNPPAGIIGLNGIALHTRNFVASYTSSVTTSPNRTTYNTNGRLASNGVIGTGGVSPNNLYGTVTLGSSGSVDATVSVSGSTNSLASGIATPTGVTMTVVSNPGGVSQTPNLNGNVTWSGGTYYFTSLTMSNGVALTFSGPATIYLDGNATLHDSDSITAYNNKPANLKICQAAGKTFDAHDDCTFVGQMQSPGATLPVHDRFTSQGSLLFQTISIHDSANIFFDEALSGSSGGGASLVK